MHMHGTIKKITIIHIYGFKLYSLSLSLLFFYFNFFLDIHMSLLLFFFTFFFVYLVFNDLFILDPFFCISLTHLEQKLKKFK